MNATIDLVPVQHNGICFYTGAKVTGRLRGVAIVKDSEGNILTAMPVSKDYVASVLGGDKEAKEAS